MAACARDAFASSRLIRTRGSASRARSRRARRVSHSQKKSRSALTSPKCAFPEKMGETELPSKASDLTDRRQTCKISCRA